MCALKSSKQSDESKSGCAAKSVNRSLSGRKLAAEVNIHLALEKHELHNCPNSHLLCSNERVYIVQ